MKIIVLGGGLVGKPMAMDLAADLEFDVTIADINTDKLKSLPASLDIKTIKADLSCETDLKKLLDPFDFVLNAVPGFLGFFTLKHIIKNKKNVVDIAFCPEDVSTLDTLAKKNQVSCISDMGVAPGMSNLLVGYVSSILDQTDDVKIYVGGLPAEREVPFEYKAGFSPIDVIEEYTRPARIVENGKEVVKEALSDVEQMTFSQIGTLEAFNSDGLRSLIKNIPAPNMIEKTLRYPGHAELMEVFRDTGFFSQEEIMVRGRRIRPIDVTAALLFPQWKLNEGEEDITIMRIEVTGKKDGKTIRHCFGLFDRYNTETGVHSMARTTGYSATMAVRTLYKGLFDEKGVFLPEYIGNNKNCVDFILDGLKERGVVFKHEIVEL